MLFAPRCPHCETPLFAQGILGEPSCCECGKMIPASLSDRARRYWALQAALPYAAATFLLGFVLFHAQLPSEPWQRMLSPSLVAPAIASLAVEYRVLVKRMKQTGGNQFLFRAYAIGMVLAGLGFIAAIIVEKL